MKKLLFCLLPLSALLAPPAAHANLSIHPMRAAVDTKRGTQIRVYRTPPSRSTCRRACASRIRRRLVRKRSKSRRPMPRLPSRLKVRSQWWWQSPDPGHPAAVGRERSGLPRLLRERQGPDGTLLEDDEPAAQANVGVSLVWGALVNVLPTNGSVDLQLQGDTLRIGPCGSALQVWLSATPAVPVRPTTLPRACTPMRS